MKKLALLLFFNACILTLASGQVPNWNMMMYQPDTKFQDIVNKVDDYFKTHNIASDEDNEGDELSPENYSRWKSFWEDRVSDGTSNNAWLF